MVSISRPSAASVFCCAIYDDFLRMYSKVEVETCCNVLRKLLDAVDATALLSNFQTELLLGLDSDSETVQHLCLVQVIFILTCLFRLQ